MLVWYGSQLLLDSSLVDLSPSFFGNLNHLPVVIEKLALVSETVDIARGIVPQGLMGPLFVVVVNVVGQAQASDLF